MKDFLAEKSVKCGMSIRKEIVLEEELPPHPSIETGPEEIAPEVAAAETPRDFVRETAATREAEFESRPRKDLHEESFPWQGKKQYEYRTKIGNAVCC